MNYIKKISSCKNKIKGFETYDVSKLLAYVSYAINVPRMVDSIRYILGFLFFDYFDINVEKGKSEFVLYKGVSNKNTRRETRETYDNIEGIIDHLNLLTYVGKIKIKLDFKLFCCFVYWFVFFMMLSVSVPKKMFYLATLCRVYRFKSKLEKVDIPHWKVLITRFDGLPIENFLVQFFSKKNLKTITLQHGFFNKSLDKYTCDGNGIIRGFISDYFFVWDLMSKKNALASGILENKIKVVGPVKLFDAVKKTDYSRKDSFCIFFDGTDRYISRNKRMLEIGKKIATLFDLHLSVKLHPQNLLSDYPEIMDDEIDLISKDASNSLILNTFDFIIVSGSSLLIESIYVGTPVFRYIDGDDDELFSYLDLPVFSSYDQLSKMLEDFYEKTTASAMYIENARKSLGMPDDVKKAYSLAFESVLNEN